MSGYLNTSNGSLSARGSNGDYWSNTQSDLSNGWRIAYDGSTCGMSSFNKAYGLTVRCLKE
jgi:uncharacterized protein (TIGR02145 family)